MVLKITEPRARPAFHFFKTGYIAMAMPAHAKYRDEIEQRSCGHLVRICGEPGEVVRTSQIRYERRSQERPATVAMMKITPVMTAIFRVEFILYLLF